MNRLPVPYPCPLPQFIIFYIKTNVPVLGLNYNKLYSIFDTSASGPIILAARQVGKSALYSGSLPLEGGVVQLIL